MLIVLVTAKGNGQKLLFTPITFQTTEGSTEFFLSEIEKQADVIFSYSNLVCFKSNLTLINTSGTIQSFLDELFLNCPVKHEIRGRKIILEPDNASTPRYVVRGYIRDQTNFESLLQANVYDLNTLQGTVTNNFGYYTLILPQGSAKLVCSYVGYDKVVSHFNLKSDTIINVSLLPKSDLGEVKVTGERYPGLLNSARTSTIHLPVEQVKNVPLLLGESDVIKTIQLLPGIQSGGEGNAGLYVRGGGPDQNLVLIDDVPVYNIDHLLGFFSVINADAVNRIEVIKGGFPARYGGRLSSVMDIRLYEGNKQKYQGSASLGLLSSKFAIEGPIKKEKSSFSLSFRRTYYDLIADFFQDDGDKSRYYFYDLNGKVSFKLSDNDNLYISGFTGKDKYGAYFNRQEMPLSANGSFAITEDENEIGWRNIIGSARWTHLFGAKLFSNFTCSYSNYRFDVRHLQNYLSDGEWNYGEQTYFSGIRDFTAKIDLNYLPSNNHHIRMGSGLIKHVFYPGINVVANDVVGGASLDTIYGGEDLLRTEYSLYLEDDFQILKRVKVNAGLRYSSFFVPNSFYQSLEPRISCRYLWGTSGAIKASYSKMTQYLHLLRSSLISMPTDIWLPVSEKTEPMQTTQYAFGVEYEISSGFNVSLEAYFKDFQNILTFRNETNFFDFTLEWDDKLSSGIGESKGLEILLQKSSGRVTGWIGYTFSKTINQFKDTNINNGEAFPANFDRTHDISIYTTYHFKKKANLSVSWTYGTGSPITLAESKYYSPPMPTGEKPFNHNYNEHIDSRNNYRMPDYHRLDIGFNFTKDTKKGERLWSFGVINAYSRQNPYFLYFSGSQDGADSQRTLNQFSLFPIPIPYVRYALKF